MPKIFRNTATLWLVASYIWIADATAIAYATQIVYCPGEETYSSGDRTGDPIASSLKFRKRHLTTAKEIVLFASLGSVLPPMRASEPHCFFDTGNSASDPNPLLQSCQPNRAPPSFRVAS